jgi:hypothetical protein
MLVTAADCTRVKRGYLPGHSRTASGCCCRCTAVLERKSSSSKRGLDQSPQKRQELATGCATAIGPDQCVSKAQFPKPRANCAPAGLCRSKSPRAFFQRIMQAGLDKRSAGAKRKIPVSSAMPNVNRSMGIDGHFAQARNWLHPERVTVQSPIQRSNPAAAPNAASRQFSTSNWRTFGHAPRPGRSYVSPFAMSCTCQQQVRKVAGYQSTVSHRGM